MRRSERLHWPTTLPTPDQVQQKGKDKGKGQGKKLRKQNSGGKSEQKGKSGKDSKRKGKGNSEVCWTCDRPGHISKGCWRVRQVEAPGTQTTAPSSQASVSQVTSTSDMNSTTASKAIRRVSQPNFGSVRVVQEQKAHRVEFHDIFTDDKGGQVVQSINAIRGHGHETEVFFRVRSESSSLRTVFILASLQMSFRGGKNPDRFGEFDA